MRRQRSTDAASEEEQSKIAITNQVGLRRRMRRAVDQIREQHERIAPLFSHLNAMLIESNLRDAQTTAFRLQGALNAHFQLEEKIVFPVLCALCPDRSGEFSFLEDDHASLESDFNELVDHILKATLATARESLSAFTFVLMEHERREEDLLQAAIGTEC
jgi:iron-sulfur cluster repair protein YtfE (RIC family)